MKRIWAWIGLVLIEAAVIAWLGSLLEGGFKPQPKIILQELEQGSVETKSLVSLIKDRKETGKVNFGAIKGTVVVKAKLNEANDRRLRLALIKGDCRRPGDTAYHLPGVLYGRSSSQLGISWEEFTSQGEMAVVLSDEGGQIACGELI